MRTTTSRTTAQNAYHEKWAHARPLGLDSLFDYQPTRDFLFSILASLVGAGLILGASTAAQEAEKGVFYNVWRVSYLAIAYGGLRLLLGCGPLLSRATFLLEFAARLTWSSLDRRLAGIVYFYSPSRAITFVLGLGALGSSAIGITAIAYSV